MMIYVGSKEGREDLLRPELDTNKGLVTLRRRRRKIPIQRRVIRTQGMVKRR